MIGLKTKKCPFCSKEISDEAIICKHCHKLLIDDKGNDIPPVQEDTPEEKTSAPEIPAESSSEQKPENTPDDNGEKTLVYSKDELKAAFQEETETRRKKKASQSSRTSQESSESADEYEPSEEEGVQTDVNSPDENESLVSDPDEYEPSETPEDISDGQRQEQEETAPETLEEGEEYYSDYDAKRTFILTAIITLGILIIIIASVCIGYKLFGAEDSTVDVTSQSPASSPASADVSSEDDSESEESSVYAPEVTDETVSAEPEESEPDENESDGGAENESVSDSQDSAADETDESSESSDSEVISGSADGSPSFEPAGGYYSWDEAYALFEAYLNANNMTGSYTYNGGTDGVEMNFLYKEDGVSTNYRVDLQTGYITAS